MIVDSDGNEVVPFVTTLYKGMGALFSQQYAAQKEAYRNPHRALVGEADLYAVLNAALGQMGDSDGKVAVENALGGGPFRGKALAERRRAMAQNLGISERTLYRRESTGAAELVVHLQDLVGSQANVQDSDSELAVLISEVRELKAMVARLESLLTGQS